MSDPKPKAKASIVEGRCLCRADIFDRPHTALDIADFLDEAPARRSGPVGRDNRFCNWPRCYRGDRNPKVEAEPTEWR